MSDYNGPDLNKPHNFFAFIIDGEVVWMHMLYEELEQMTAVYGSNPTIVQVPKDLGGIVSMGWKFQDGVFNAPDQ